MILFVCVEAHLPTCRPTLRIAQLCRRNFLSSGTGRGKPGILNLNLNLRLKNLVESLIYGMNARKMDSRALLGDGGLLDPYIVLQE